MNGSTESGPTEFWTRLRRRKVVQWGVLYVAGAWGFLQGLQYVSDAFQWPPAVRQVALLVVLIGLPIALVLAWYHGDRGQQRVGRTELAIITLLFLFGGGIFWWYERTTEGSSTAAVNADASKASISPTDARPSIAVLPFENRSREADDAFFVDGIHDDILTQLSKIGALRVISRTSVEQFRGTKLSMKAIADQLGVTKILEGGVQRGGDRVRINVQLIDANSDAHVWAETYDRELTAANIFAIQSELAGAIAGALKATLTPGEQARAQLVPTQNLAAWQAYQLGRQQMAKRTTAALNEAETYLRQALELDPRFALAWAALGDTLLLQPYYAGLPMDDGIRDAQQAVDRALSLNPDLAEAWAAAGNIAMDRRQYDLAEQSFRRAISLSPSYAPAHHWLSMTLSELGRRNESLTVAEHAFTLDPYSAVINNWLGEARRDAGRFDDAIPAFARAVQIEPTYVYPYANIAGVEALGLDRFDIAIPWFEKAASLDPENPVTLAWLVEAYWNLGDDAATERSLRRMLSTEPKTSYPNLVAAFVRLQNGDRISALTFAQIAAESDPQALFILRDFDLRRRDYAVARARYAKAAPHLFAANVPVLRDRDLAVAVSLALVLQHTGEADRARVLLDRSEAYIRTIPRLGDFGFGFTDVDIYALRGETARALAALREAEKAGCRNRWHYHRDYDPALASIRNEPEFKAVFADIERDMAQQRARLAARPKDAPLELTEASR